MKNGYSIFIKNCWYVMPTESKRVSKDMIKRFAREICSEFSDEQIDLAFENENEVKAWRKIIHPCRFESREIGTKHSYGKCIETENGYHLEVGKIDRPSSIGNYKQKEFKLIET